MKSAVEEKQITLNEVMTELQLMKSMVMVSRGITWVPRKVLSTLTGLKERSIDTYVSAGNIVKKGTLYSYTSYLEFCGIHSKKGMN
jgi:hypothetical protein